MVYGSFNEATAHREPGMSRADYDGGDASRRPGSGDQYDSVYLYRDVGRIGNDIEHRRSFLRLGDQRFDVFFRSVCIYFVLDLDAVEAVSNVAVNAQDSLYIHSALLTDLS